MTSSEASLGNYGAVLHEDIYIVYHFNCPAIFLIHFH